MINNDVINLLRGSLRRPGCFARAGRVGADAGALSCQGGRGSRATGGVVFRSSGLFLAELPAKGDA